MHNNYSTLQSDPQAAHLLNHLHFRVLMVGPERATLWRDNAEKVAARDNRRVNRPLSARRTKILAQAIREDEFKPVGDPIRLSFDPEFGDYCTDAQHRLEAIIQCEATLPFLVFVDFPSQLFPYLDGRGPRKAPDVLYVAGESNTVRLAAMARWIWLFERKIADSTNVLDPYEVINMVKRHPGLHRWCQVPSNTPVGGKAVVGAAFYWIERSGHPKAQEFSTGVMSGENLLKGSPALVLRNRLLENRKTDGTRSLLSALCFSAWDSHLRGKTIVQFSAGAVKWPRGCPYLADSDERRGE